VTSDQTTLTNDLPRAKATTEVEDNDIVMHSHATAVYMQF